MITEVLLFLFTLLLTKKWLRDLSYSKFQGPSPWLSFPLVGHGYMVALNPGQTLISMHKRYGDLFRLDLGNIPTIWLCTTEALKEAYAKEEFSGRFFNEMPTFVETIQNRQQGTCKKDILK